MLVNKTSSALFCSHAYGLLSVALLKQLLPASLILVDFGIGVPNYSLSGAIQSSLWLKLINISHLVRLSLRPLQHIEHVESEPWELLNSVDSLNPFRPTQLELGRGNSDIFTNFIGS